MRRAIGSEGWFLLALIPLLRPQPIVSFAHDVIIASLFVAVVAAVLLRRRLSPRALSTLAYAALLPVVALGLHQAGRVWATILLLFWSGVLVWHFLRSRPVVIPARGPLMWLMLVTVTWAFLFLLVSDLFLGGLEATGPSAADRLLSLLMVAGLFAAVALGACLWWDRRDSPAAIAATTLIALSILLVSEGRHDLRLWRGAREVRRLEAQGAYAQARDRLDNLWELSRAKGRYLVHPDLALSAARLDVRDGYPDRAVERLLWVADHAPDRQAEVCRLLDVELLSQLLQMPARIRDAFALFSDFESAPDGNAYVLDRWGRVFRATPDSLALSSLFPDPIPGGTAAVDLEPLPGRDGLVILDYAGNLHLRGPVPADFRDLVRNRWRPLAGAVDLELSPGGRGFYVVNAYGDLAVCGGTRFAPDDNPHHWNYAIIRDLEVAPGETGLVLLDGYGGLHPIGQVPFDPKEPGAPYWFEILAEDIEFHPSGGLYLMNRRGEWARFGEAPLDPAAPAFPHIGGVDFEIAGDGAEIAVLHPSGAVERFRFGEQRAADLLAEVNAARERGDLTLVWEKAREAAGLDPGSVPTLRSRFDPAYYEGFLRAAPKDEPDDPLWRKLAWVDGRSFVLDAWGQIFAREGDRFRPLLDAPPVPPGEWAADFCWVGDPPRPVILTEQGTLCYPEDLSPGLQRLLAQAPTGIQAAVALRILEHRDQGYILSRFGQIYPFGSDPVGTPAEWQPRWDSPVAVDFAVVSGGRGILILDCHGALHRVGEVGIDTRGPGAPWWEDPVAVGLAASPAGDSLAVVNRLGSTVAVGDWQEQLQPEMSPAWSELSVVDIDFCPEASAFRVLTWNGRELVVPLGEKAADRLAEQARQSLALGDTLAAVRRMIQAAHAAPDKAALTLRRFDAAMLEVCAAAPVYHPAAVPEGEPPEVVVAGLPGDSSGTLVLLDRFGRIWDWSGGDYGLRVDRTIPLDREGRRRAVAFRPHGDGFTVLDSFGGLTAHSADASTVVREGVVPDPPERTAVDFAAWGGGFLVLDSFGKITPVGLEEGALPALPNAFWDFPIARRLHLAGSRAYVLDGLGGIHGPPDQPGEMTSGAAYFTLDLVRDFEPDAAGTGFFVMDFAGRISRTGGARPHLNPALTPPETRTLDAALREFEKRERDLFRNLALGERKFTADDYARFDSAVDLVGDVRDGALYVVFRSGRVAPIWGRKEDALRYAALARMKRSREDIPGCLAELTRALVVSPDPRLLEPYAGGFLAELSRLEIPSLRFARDLEPSDRPGSAFVLDMWGRIFEWSGDGLWKLVHSAPLPQGENGTGEAVAFARSGPDAFLVLTSAGELIPCGTVPESVERIAAHRPPDLRNAADLALTRNGDVAAVATAHGEVWRLTPKGSEPWPGDRIFWGEEVARSVELRGDGAGCLLYDRFGGIHPYGDVSTELAEAAPYLDLPLMTDVWLDEDGSRAAFLRVDGSVFLSGGFDAPVWHPRFLGPGLSRFRPNLATVRDAAGKEISPAVDLELSADRTTLFVLRGNGDVIRVWRTEAGAREELARGREALAAGDLSEALVRLDRAVFLGPGVLQSDDFAWTELPDKVRALPPDAAPPLPFFVDLVVAEGTTLLLDRWGGLHQSSADGLTAIRAYGRTAASGASAVALAALTGTLWIAYEDGEIETWRTLAPGGGSVRVPVEWPRELVVDLSLEPTGTCLFACTSTGRVVRLRLPDLTPETIHSAGWEFPLGVAYTPENEADGYLLDRVGPVHHVGAASIFTRFSAGRPAPQWRQGWARDLCLTPGRSGLLLLDVFGGIHVLGMMDQALSVEGLPYHDQPIAARMTIHDGRVIVLDANGRVSSSLPLPPGI